MIDIIYTLIQSDNYYIVLLSGLLIGVIHAFEPDHLSAVSTQIQQKSNDLEHRLINSSLYGVLWGVGHTSGIVMIGVAVVLLSITIPEEFFVGAEMLVGITLIVLGIFAIYRTRHSHPHTHSDGTVHSHPHTRGHHTHGHRSYIIGCLHGVAGSGGLIILISVGLGSIESLIPFLMIFGIGSIMGMAIASGVIGIPLTMIKADNTRRYLKAGMASVAVIIGSMIIIEISSEIVKTWTLPT